MDEALMIGHEWAGEEDGDMRMVGPLGYTCMLGLLFFFLTHFICTMAV